MILNLMAIRPHHDRSQPTFPFSPAIDDDFEVVCVCGEVFITMSHRTDKINNLRVCAYAEVFITLSYRVSKGDYAAISRITPSAH